MTRNAYDSTIPVYLEIFKIGLKNATPSQKAILNDASQILKRGDTLSMKLLNNFGTQLKEFIKKYEIKY